MQIAIAENSRVALDQDEYEKRYAELTARYEKAFKLYKQSADAGNPEAMHNVAVMLIQPVGCVQNVKMAIDYYVKASQAGYNPSTYNLGHSCHNQDSQELKSRCGSAYQLMP